jgi:hypothetical protein
VGMKEDWFRKRNNILPADNYASCNLGTGLSIGYCVSYLIYFSFWYPFSQLFILLNLNCHTVE